MATFSFNYVTGGGQTFSVMEAPVPDDLPADGLTQYVGAIIGQIMQGITAAESARQEIIEAS